MKISISFLPEEGREALAVLSNIRKDYPTARIRSGKRSLTYQHFYISTKRPDERRIIAEKP